MGDILKGIWKWILAILIILLLGGAILAFRIFVIDKDFDGKSEEARKRLEASSSSSSDSTDTTSSKNGGSLGQKIVNGAKSIANSTVKGYKEDEENYDYNTHNFDEAFLMYEGERYHDSVKDVLQHLIDNSNGTFYARTAVTAVNFGNNVTVKYEGNLVEYQSAIQTLNDSVEEGLYDISFKYGGFGTYVNEIVITKK